MNDENNGYLLYVEIRCCFANRQTFSVLYNLIYIFKRQLYLNIAYCSSDCDTISQCCSDLCRWKQILQKERSGREMQLTPELAMWECKSMKHKKENPCSTSECGISRFSFLLFSLLECSRIRHCTLFSLCSERAQCCTLCLQFHFRFDTRQIFLVYSQSRGDGQSEQLYI